MAGRTVNVLNVAEKPSVAKSVATIPSRNQGLRVREGRSRYNKIFEFNYAIRGQPCHMLFTSVTGHLMELEFEERYRKWLSCDPADLYHAPVHKFVPEVLDTRHSVIFLLHSHSIPHILVAFNDCFDFDHLLQVLLLSFVESNLLNIFSPFLFI